MKIFYQITSNELGTVLLKKRKIAKALRWWLRENGYTYKYMFFVS
jgi:diadenosine tetraphosphate (Ap4A) HIT family hydrolase